jgi:hypothetical protein
MTGRRGHSRTAAVRVDSLNGMGAIAARSNRQRDPQAVACRCSLVRRTGALRGRFGLGEGRLDCGQPRSGWRVR